MLSASFSLKGRTALVTGSTQGIGRSILLAFAEAGARVLAHGLEEPDAAAPLLEEARGFGGEASYFVGDLTQPGAGRDLAEAAKREAGGIDILVLCAAIQIRKPWTELTSADWDRHFQSNCVASLELLQTLVPEMAGRGWGRVLAIGSIQQHRPDKSMLAYAATKSAQMNIVINLAKQYADSGITVNNLAPGVIATPRNAEALKNPATAEHWRKAIPAGRFGEPGDCAGAALLLCSDAGAYITGQSLGIDGGLSL